MMEITGDKVILRTIQEQDTPLLQNLINDPEITKITRGYSPPVSYEHQIHWFQSAAKSDGRLHSIIADRENPQTGLGILILSNMDLNDKSAEIYIKLEASARRKGYGQDAVNTLAAYAFDELGLLRIYASVLEENTASRRLFETCGFRQESRYKSRVYSDGHYRNICVYGIRKAR